MKRFKATGATADKTTPCRRKSVRVRKVVEAVKRSISRKSPTVAHQSHPSPASVPSSFRLLMYAEDGNIRVYACSCDWNTFPRIPWNFEADMSYRFLIKHFFRWVNLYGAPCSCKHCLKWVQDKIESWRKDAKASPTSAVFSSVRIGALPDDILGDSAWAARQSAHCNAVDSYFLLERFPLTLISHRPLRNMMLFHVLSRFFFFCICPFLRLRITFRFYG